MTSAVLLSIFQWSQFAAAVSPLPDIGQALSVDGTSIRVKAGDYVVGGGRTVHIASEWTTAVRPADIALVSQEELRLPDVEPGGFWRGAMLAGPRTVGINALGSFIEESLVVRDAKSGRTLEKGKDYRVSGAFALLGLGTDTDLTPNDPVYASYRYRMQRIDSIVSGADGRLQLVEGAPAVAEPLPPALGPGQVRLANVYRPYGATTVLPEHLYAVVATARDAKTRTTPGLIPGTLDKLRRGRPAKIVCLGNSITAGGDASDPSMCYVEQFARGLRKRFPESRIEVVNISMGGTRSAQWLDNGNYPGTARRPSDKCTFDRVTQEKPDLVTVEFLNDMTLPVSDLPALYGEMLDRLKGVGAELVLIAPGFCHPTIMGATSLTDADSRPYVPFIHFLHAFASKHGIAYADVAGRWEHLRLEGLPYMTLLRNQYNHPGDRGHALYAEELLKCFDEKPAN